MATLDKEVQVLMLKGQKGNSSYQDAVDNGLFVGTLEEWIQTYATPENYLTRREFQKVTQEEYDEMAETHSLEPNCYYFITDDDTWQTIQDLLSDVSALDSDIDAVDSRLEIVENDLTNNVKPEVSQNSTEVSWLNVHARIKEDTYQYFSQTDLLYDNTLGYLPNVVLSLKQGKTVSDTIGISGCLEVTTSGDTVYNAFFDTHWNVYDSKEANISVIPVGSLLTVLKVDLKLDHDAIYGDILYLTENPSLKTFASGSLTIKTITLNGIKIYYK